MNVNIVVPRSLADMLGLEPADVLRYPKTGNTIEQQALWLTESIGGPWQWTTYNASPLPVTRRLLFVRWLHRADFLARGGVL